VNQAGIEADRSSFEPILIPDEVINHTLNSESGAVVEQEQVKLAIRKAAEKTEETLDYYQQKLREKEHEYCKLFDQVRDQVLESKIFQIKCAENKKERRAIKDSIKSFSKHSEVHDDSRAMFLPQKAVQKEEVPTYSSQKVEVLSAVLPQKVETDRRPSNSIEKADDNSQYSSTKLNDIQFTSERQNNDSTNSPPPFLNNIIISQNSNEDEFQITIQPTINSIIKDENEVENRNFLPSLDLTPPEFFEEPKPITPVDPLFIPTTDPLYSNHFSAEALIRNHNYEDRRATIDEKLPDQFLPPLQSEALQIERSTSQQTFNDHEKDASSLETYSEQNISLDNLASPDLFDFLSPISQQNFNTEVNMQTETLPEICKPDVNVIQTSSQEIFEPFAEVVNCFTFDDLADVPCYYNPLSPIEVQAPNEVIRLKEETIICNPTDKEHVTFVEPEVGAKFLRVKRKFPIISPNIRKIIRRRAQEWFTSFHQHAEYSISHPFEEIDYFVTFNRTKEGGFGKCFKF
jgi:hypothetical protein